MEGGKSLCARITCKGDDYPCQEGDAEGELGGRLGNGAGDGDELDDGDGGHVEGKADAQRVAAKAPAMTRTV